MSERERGREAERWMLRIVISQNDMNQVEGRETWVIDATILLKRKQNRQLAWFCKAVRILDRQ